ncbi:MAG: flippase-like domain-containing protein [Deltaproteobacteria bacterium]|nr:flippase-like domain-containing protein [Deltaproteobacteria bacterium]
MTYPVAVRNATEKSVAGLHQRGVADRPVAGPSNNNEWRRRAGAIGCVCVFEANAMSMSNAPATDRDTGPTGGAAAALPEMLRHRAAREALGHSFLLLAFFYAVNPAGALIDSLWRIIPAAAVLTAVHGLLWRHLHRNRLPGAPVIASRLGAANRITLLRGLLISLTAGFLFDNTGGDPAASAFLAWLPGGLYLTAAVLDGVDGAWARRTGTTTPLGQTLDVQFDALGVMVACAVAVSTRRLPAYYLVAGAAYYLFQLGLCCRRRRGKPIYPAGSRTFARLMAGFQMGFLGIALLPIFTDKVLAVVAPVFLLPLLAGFVWDWWVMRGRIDAIAIRRWETRVLTLSAKAPPVLRGGLLVAGGGMLISSPGAPFSGSLFVPAGLGLMVVAGVAGRTAALLLSLVLAYRASVAGISPLLMTTMVGTLLILLTGTGAGSLWRPEDAFLLEKPVDGEPSQHLGSRMRRKDTRLGLSPMNRFSFRSTVVKLLIVMAVAGLLYWAWRGVSLDVVVSAIGRWRWFQWLLFAVLNLFILGAMCWRWSFILRQMGHPVGFAALIRCRMGANFLSYITPGPQFGGEPFQVYCLVTRHQVPAEAASASVAVDRLLELMGTLLFLSLGGIIVLPSLVENSAVMLTVVAVMAGVVLIIGVLLYALATGGAPLSRLIGRAVQWIGWQKGVPTLVAFLQAGERQASGILTNRFCGWYALGGLLQWSGFLAELWIIYAFIGTPLSAYALLTVAVAARLAFLLPLPGGLGALEASQMLALTSLGGDPAAAAAACGIMRVRDLMVISTGAGLALRWRQSSHAKTPVRPPDAA